MGNLSPIVNKQRTLIYKKIKNPKLTSCSSLISLFSSAMIAAEIETKNTMIIRTQKTNKYIRINIICNNETIGNHEIRVSKSEQ